MAQKKKPSDEDKLHGRSREVKHVVSQMSDVDFFDYRLVVRTSGIADLNAGHSGLRQGLIYVESLVEEMRSGNYASAQTQLLRSLQVFEESYNLIRRALTDLGEYYNDHPTEVREINHGLTEMCDGCDCLVKALVSLRQVKIGESIELSRRALTHLREAAHRIGSHLRDIKDCCPSNVEFEVMDIRDDENRVQVAGMVPVDIAPCQKNHAPGEPCDRPHNQSNNGSTSEDRKAEIEPAISRDVKLPAAPVPKMDDATAELVQQVQDKHVPLDQVAEAVQASDPSDVQQVPLISRDLSDESAMEDLMKHVSENRAKTIDKLVADARAAKAEAIGGSGHVPVPGEQVPGMQPMSVKTGPMQAAAQVVDITIKPANDMKDKAAERAEKVDKKSEKSGKKSEKGLQKALEKAKETTSKRPPRKASKSETSMPALPKPEKKKKDEDLSELTFDDSDFDFNKAGKKKS